MGLEIGIKLKSEIVNKNCNKYSNSKLTLSNVVVKDKWTNLWGKFNAKLEQNKSRIN